MDESLRFFSVLVGDRSQGLILLCPLEGSIRNADGIGVDWVDIGRNRDGLGGHQEAVDTTP